MIFIIIFHRTVRMRSDELYRVRVTTKLHMYDDGNDNEDDDDDDDNLFVFVFVFVFIICDGSDNCLFH